MIASKNEKTLLLIKRYLLQIDSNNVKMLKTTSQHYCY